MFRRESQRQNVEEDRRGYGGRFEERACGKLSQVTKISTEPYTNRTNLLSYPSRDGFPPRRNAKMESSARFPDLTPKIL